MVMGLLDIPPSRIIRYAIYATAPVSVILGIINLIRLNRFSMGALWIFIFTLAAAGATLALYPEDNPGIEP